MNGLSINTKAGLEVFKKMASDGVAPEDIAKRFGMTVSNVHYHKKKLKEQGMEFPNVRGQRPKKNTVIFYKMLPNGEIIKDKFQPTDKSTSSGSNAEDDPNEMKIHLIDDLDNRDYRVTINGTVFFISPTAKEIHINGRDAIEVNF